MARANHRRSYLRPWPRTPATSWRWPTVPSGEWPTPTSCSRPWPPSRPGRSPPTRSSSWARHTSRPADTPRRSRRCERYLAENPRGEVAEFALADLVAAQLGAGRTEDAGKTLALLARQFPAGKALPRARLRIAEAALAARQFDRAVEQFHLVTGPVSPAASAPDGKSTTAIEPALRVRALAGLGHAPRGPGPFRRGGRGLRRGRGPGPFRPGRARDGDGPGPRPRGRQPTRRRARPPTRTPPAGSPVGTKAAAPSWPGRGCWPGSGGTSRRPRSSSDCRPIPRCARPSPGSARRPTCCSPNRAGRWWMPPGPPRPIECSPGC